MSARADLVKDRLRRFDADRDSDERMQRLAAKAFELGLINGRAIVRPISREALADRLGLTVIGSPNCHLRSSQVSFEELNALRVTYGAAHKASAAGRRR